METNAVNRRVHKKTQPMWRGTGWNLRKGMQDFSFQATLLGTVPNGSGRRLAIFSVGKGKRLRGAD
jgi:hypothetical protein